MRDYRLVYQSGHTNTYCNGDTHKRTYGGWVGIIQEKPGELEKAPTYKCDCARWAEFNASLRSDPRTNGKEAH